MRHCKTQEWPNCFEWSKNLKRISRYWMLTGERKVQRVMNLIAIDSMRPLTLISMLRINHFMLLQLLLLSDYAYFLNSGYTFKKIYLLTHTASLGQSSNIINMAQSIWRTSHLSLGPHLLSCSRRYVYMLNDRDILYIIKNIYNKITSIAGFLLWLHESKGACQSVNQQRRPIIRSKKYTQSLWPVLYQNW